MATTNEKKQALLDALEAARKAGDTDRIAELTEEAEQFNFCSKTVKPADAYEVWSNGNWTWLVLKKYVSPAKERTDRSARWLCLVDGYELEMGDVYARDVKRNARQLQGEDAEQERARVAAMWRY